MSPWSKISEVSKIRFSDEGSFLDWLSYEGTCLFGHFGLGFEAPKPTPRYAPGQKYQGLRNFASQMKAKIGSFYNWLHLWGHMCIWAFSGRGLNLKNPPPRCAPGQKYRMFLIFASQMRAQNQNFLKLAIHIRALAYLGTFAQGFEPREPTP